MGWDLFTIMLKNNFAKFFLAIIIIVHLFLLTKLIFFPYPELFVYPYLKNQGLIPYKQILDQHFPGLLFSPVNFDNLGMTTPEAARIWLIIAVAITQILLFFISREILKSEKKALVVNVLYLIWQPFFEGWVLWIDTFLPILLLPAFYNLYRKKYIWTGLLLGGSVVFKQVIIPLALILPLYIFWETKKFKQALLYILSLLAPILIMILYLIRIGVLSDFIYWTIIFNITVFAQMGRGTGSTLAHFTRVALVFGSAFIALLRIKERLVAILLIFLVGSLMGLSTRFDFVHFQPALPFAVLATVLVVERVGKIGRIGLIGVATYIAVSVWWQITFYRGHIGEKIFFFDKDTLEIAEKIKGSTKEGEKIFVFGAVPHLYQMSKTLPAGDIFVFQFPWFYKVAEKRILEGIMRDKPEIVASDRTVKIEDQPITEFAKEIDQYILQNYEPIDRVGTTDILRRKPQ